MSFSNNVCLFLFVVHCAPGHAEDRAELPEVADGFTVSVFASDPLVRNPCAMAFDVRGRLFVGQGPQYRKPKPNSPTDRITVLIDSDADGVADQAKTFASGFNSIQGLACGSSCPMKSLATHSFSHETMTLTLDLPTRNFSRFRFVSLRWSMSLMIDELITSQAG